MATCRTDINAHGLRVIHLENERLRVSLIPEAGGKISAITDRRSGRNWLWSNPDLPIRKSDRISNYGSQLDSGGWDEILFSVEPCDARTDNRSRLSIPDHGDLVGRSWNIDFCGQTATGTVCCSLSVDGCAADYAWQRNVTVDAENACVKIDYSFRNTGDTILPFFWCAHPLLAADEAIRIRLPENQKFSVDKLSGAESQSEYFDWPMLPLRNGQYANLARSFDDGSAMIGKAAKVFVRSTSPGAVSIETVNREECLRLEYDDVLMPWLGIWINNRGWSGSGSDPYVNLGIEPATVRFDSLADAIDAGKITMVTPGETKEWSLTLRADVSRS